MVSEDVIQAELDRIHEAIRGREYPEKHNDMYAAQQALAWAVEPEGAKSPYAMIMGIQEDLEGCSADPRPVPS